MKRDQKCMKPNLQEPSQLGGGGGVKNQSCSVWSLGFGMFEIQWNFENWNFFCNSPQTTNQSGGWTNRHHSDQLRQSALETGAWKPEVSLTNNSIQIAYLDRLIEIRNFVQSFGHSYCVISHFCFFMRCEVQQYIQKFKFKTRPFQYQFF